ncbi:MAG: FAD-binding oxidoreductase [Rubrivivax sp.]|jgi:FAD/FMN-containing dehydrogenase|nr:FAD-binding oxidoreductase [Rubrivivax sp.]
MFDRTRTQQATAALATELPGLEWITDSRVERLSQDFYWFSPVLKRQLAELRADAVVRPRTEDEIRAAVAGCARAGIPITVRGSGTGNYGQCMPLHGGVILDLSAYNRLLWAKPGVARAQAGIRMMEMDRQLQQGVAGPDGRPGGAWELRCVPSTFRSATLGGLYGGGFGGVGSINYGPLASTGNVLGVKAMTVEPEPKTVELRAPEALLLHHVYGTNGLVLELEVALAPAHPWLEAIVCFDGFDEAIGFADALASAPGIVKKSVTLLAAPIPDLLMAATPLMAGSMNPGSHAVFVLVAEFAEPALQQLVAEFGGGVTLRKTAEEVTRSNRTIVEYTWNHTTLHAMKVDKSLTYIQSGYDAGRHVAQAKALRERLGDEVLVHLEFIRTKEGAMNCSGLQLVRYRDDERLDEIMRIHRDHGVFIANPHVYIVEDGKQGQVNPDVVATKMRFDPAGLLNPGKLRGWEVREQIMADAAAGRVSLATLPRF